MQNNRLFQNATWTPVLSRFLVKYTWLELSPQLSSITHKELKKRNVTIEEVLAVQELSTVCKTFHNIITAWFVREWKHKNWVCLFKKFELYYFNSGKHCSARTIAWDYLKNLIATKIIWDHWGEIRSRGFMIRANEMKFVTYLFVYSERNICHVVFDYKAQRHVTFIDLKSGKKLCPDRTWAIVSPFSGFEHQIDSCLKCFDHQQLCKTCYRTNQHPLCDSIITLVMPQFYNFFLPRFSWGYNGL